MATVSAPMMVSVAAALRLLGFLKLGTPLLTASTPVRAVQPEAKARNTNARSRRPLACCCALTPIGADSATGGLPPTTRKAPSASMAKTQTTKP